MGLDRFSSEVEETLNPISTEEDLSRCGIPTKEYERVGIHGADRPLRLAQRIVKECHRSYNLESFYGLPYSLKFLEIHDIFSKYGKVVPDEDVTEILREYAEFSKREFKIYIDDDYHIENGSIADEIFERFAVLEQLNGSESSFKSRLESRVRRLGSFFASIGHNGISTKVLAKLAFAIERISERAMYDSDFIFIDNVFAYIATHISVEINNNHKIDFVRLILEDTVTPIASMLESYTEEYGYMNVESGMGIEDKETWFTFYRSALKFLAKSFLREDEEDLSVGYSRVLALFHNCDDLLPPNLFNIEGTTAKFENSYRDVIDLEHFGSGLIQILVDNCKVRNEIEWNRYCLSRFLLELIGKIAQVEKHYDSEKLRRSTDELVDKLCTKKTYGNLEEHEFVRFEEGDCPEGNHVVILTKVKVKGIPRNIKIVIARPKSPDSVLRKLMAKDVQIDQIRDFLRGQCFIEDRELLDNPETRDEVCAAVITALMTRLGSDYDKSSVKSSFDTGRTNPLSEGLRCFKLALKINTSESVLPVELMILAFYPPNHGEYEERTYKKMFENFSLCSYDQAMQQLAEELSSRAMVGLDPEEAETLLPPLFHYILNVSDRDRQFNSNFLKNILYIYNKVKSDSVVMRNSLDEGINVEYLGLEYPGIDIEKLKTKMEVLKTLLLQDTLGRKVHFVAPSLIVEEDKENQFQSEDSEEE